MNFTKKNSTLDLNPPNLNPIKNEPLTLNHLSYRWSSREESRIDEHYEENTVEAAAGGKEVKKIFFLTGAEKER
jgi:hypothetical protein